MPRQRQATLRLPPVRKSRLDKELEKDVKSRRQPPHDERANEQSGKIFSIPARRQDQAHNNSHRNSSREYGLEAAASKQALRQTLRYTTNATARLGGAVLTGSATADYNALGQS